MCGCCQVLCYVGDGGALVGRCALCGNVRPGQKKVMLNPKQLKELRVTPCLPYNALMGMVSHPPSDARHSPQKFKDVSVLQGRGIMPGELGEDA